MIMVTEDYILFGQQMSACGKPPRWYRLAYRRDLRSSVWAPFGVHLLVRWWHRG